MTTLVEQISSERLQRGTVVLAYAIGIIGGSATVAGLLTLVG